MSLWTYQSMPLTPLMDYMSAVDSETLVAWPGDDGGDLVLPQNGTGAVTPAGVSTARSFAYVIGFCLFMAMLVLG